MREKHRRIRAAAPIRICDVGGWTDTWFAVHGSVFNIAVTPLVEVQVNTQQQDSEFRVILHLENFGDTYSLNPENITYGKHPLLEAIIDTMEIPEDLSLEINVFSAAPSGASVGTSAAVSVALVGALDALTPGRLAPKEAAKLAHRIETEKLGLQSGVQDQICSACGGVNFIRIESYPDAVITPLSIPDEVLWELESRLALVYIGMPHSSDAVHKKVIADLGKRARTDPRIDGLRKLANDAKDAAISGDLPGLGRIMSRSTDWQRQLHPELVGDKFEEIIDTANSFDALGCKVNGAGGDGGSITVLGDGDAVKRRKMLKALKEKGFQEIPISLSARGLRVWEEN
jgi:D-glycero-alpha-D-manno-heptose-7-phosphate kinase